MVRTNRSLRDTVSLYAPASFNYDADDFLTTGMAFPATATASNVQARLWPSTDIDVPNPIGRTPRDIMDTTDILVLENSQACGAGWMLELTTAGHPDQGQRYIVLGNAKNLTYHAGTRRFFVKKSTRPPRS